MNGNYFVAFLAALSMTSAGEVTSPALDFSRLVDEVHISYETRQSRPYVQHAHDTLHVPLIKDLIRTWPGGIPRWPDAVRDTLCNTCAFLVGNIVAEFYTGTPIEDIQEQAIQLCVTFHLYPEEVCRGAVYLATPSLAEVLGRRNLTGDEICMFAIGARCGTTLWPQWEVKLPDKPKPRHTEPVLPQPSETTTMKILHISDPHVDLNYTVGSLADCDLPMCCRAELGPDPNGTTGQYGALAPCDIPKQTLAATLDWITENHPDIEMVYMTGDLPPHDIWNQSKEANLLSIREGMQIFKERFPNTPLFSSIGNHAPCFIDEYPPESTMSPSNNISWLTDTFEEIWPTLFPTEVSPGTIQRGSYYSTRAIPGKLRVISINSNFCNNINWWLLLDSVDPSGELQWLVDQLQEAEELGEKVHLLSHIPTGTTDCIPVWSHQFTRIVNRFEDTIAAQFYGHTHKDEFEVYYDLEDEERAVGVAYIAPAATTYSYLNPTYRIFTVDTNSTWMALEYETFWMNLTAANTAGDTSFSREYSALHDLVEAPLTPQNFHRLAERMKTDRVKFDQYWRYFYHSRKAEEEAGPCDEACRQVRICAAQTADSSRPRC